MKIERRTKWKMKFCWHEILKYFQPSKKDNKTLYYAVLVTYANVFRAPSTYITIEA